eukprot:Rmarinus@m.5197
MSEWSSLQKQVRSLETEIDAKLSALGSCLGQLEPNHDDLVHSSDHLLAELENLLQKLRVAHEGMAECANREGSKSTMMYTLQRKTEVLHEFEVEYRRIRERVQQMQQTSELLGGYKSNENDEYSMRETSSLMSSHQAVDSVLEQAVRTKETLGSQKAIFENINNRMITVVQSVPGINSLLSRIRTKKKQDSIIIWSLIGLCMFFIIIYIF